ncbi:MAG: hypothetical protein E6H09_13245 [Bacteroidetes bacterium]|jgi:hypothetical protein|nr:MAG: hypothetical protein E6H09_13245 [Bacteroidota bacterium]
MPATAALVAIVLFVSFFACVFGIYYMFTRRNLAMIEKGMNPRERINRPAPYKNLKWALLLIGSGMGLFLAYILGEYVLYQTGSWTGENGITHYYRQENNPAVYFALIAIGGGIGLFFSYKMEKKWWDENKPAAQS